MCVIFHTPLLKTSSVPKEKNFGLIPLDLIRPILSYLDTYNFAKSSLVCKTWEVFGKDETLWRKIILNELERKGYSKRVFGPKEWQEFHGIATHHIKYPRNLCKELDKPSPFFLKKTVGQTSYIQCMIKEIKNCADLALFMKNNTGYFESNEDIIKEKEISLLENADWYIIPETILPNSSNKTLEGQIFKIEKEDPSYRLATLFEISLVAFNHFISTKELMLNKNPYVYTRAISTSNQENFYIIGAFQTAYALTLLRFDKDIKALNTGIIPLKQLDR